ncbi:MAG: AAA family ATPase [Oscillospiraceae bacterium]|nr:AAA family ATPase [Oscillospiraceae bacterium]
MAKKPYIVGISGGTCSGKSTLSDKLKKMLGEKYAVSLLNMDNYYQWSLMKTIAPITRMEYPEHNHPDAVDKDRLYKDFNAAISDKSNDIAVIEGVFSLFFDRIREKLDLKVFVDLQSDERMYRRIKRMYESLDDTAHRYLDTVRYRHDEFVEPTRWHADIVINGTLDANLGTNVIATYIEAQINKIS